MMFRKKDVIDLTNFKKISDDNIVFISGNLIITKKDDRYNIIDFNRNVLFESLDDYKIVDNAIIVVKNNKKGLIDNYGNVLFDIIYDNLKYCNDRVIYEHDDIYYLVTLSKKTIYKCEFISSIDGNLFMCHSRYKDTNLLVQSFIIDKNGNKIMNVKDNKKNSIYQMINDKYIRGKIDNKTYIYDLSGNLLLKTNTRNIKIIENGKVYMINKNDRIFLANLDEKTKLKLPRYYKYWDSDKYGNILFYDKSLKKYLLCDNEMKWHELDKNITFYYVDDGYIYGNKDEESILEFVYDIKSKRLVGGYAAVEEINNYVLAYNNDKYGIVDFENNIKLPFEYDEIFILNNVFLAIKDGVSYLYNEKFKLIFTSSKIDYVDSNDYFIVLKEDGYNFLINTNGDVIVPHCKNEINIVNHHLILINNYIIDTNLEYLNISIDYQLLAEFNGNNYVFHNKSKEKREMLKMKIENDINNIMNEYVNGYDKNKEYKIIRK